ncbi:hypothetical protein [Sagittula sp. SSi028]|uniref:hypothetical protein n=1 Tax=Sagittula sp. SSi028 TaxID=3400636 RepID=UPI003AF839A3
MHETRFQAMNRQAARKGVPQPQPQPTWRQLRGGGRGPVYRAGPSYHNPALLDADDPAAELLAQARNRASCRSRLARGAALFAASVMSSPAVASALGLG